MIYLSPQDLAALVTAKVLTETEGRALVAASGGIAIDRDWMGLPPDMPATGPSEAVEAPAAPAPTSAQGETTDAILAELAGLFAEPPGRGPAAEQLNPVGKRDPSSLGPVVIQDGEGDVWYRRPDGTYCTHPGNITSPGLGATLAQIRAKWGVRE